MNEGLKTILYPVKDLAKAKVLYSALLGAKPYIDLPHYAAFKTGGKDLGLDPNGGAGGLEGSVGFWHVADIRKSIDQLIALGAQSVEEPKDVGAGNLVAIVKDVDGNQIGLFQAA